MFEPGLFSYASVLCEENRIVYVYIETGDEDLLIPEEYLPKEFNRVNSQGYEEYYFNFAVYYTDKWENYLEE